MGLSSSTPPAPSVVTPGNYDGVHLGHRALVEKARELAGRATPKLTVKALTFDPHPMQLMAKDRAPPLLTSPERRAELLRGAGADEVVIRTFDEAFASLSPQAFVDQVLVGELGARAVVVGHDFRFGARRAGDAQVLTELCAAHGIQVATLPPVTLEGQIVSSSQVRAALARGDVELAARMLTRVHDVTRRVVTGAQRGRTLGFPTANLELEGFMVPADGVYAVVARVLDGSAEERSVLHAGVANLGERPTLRAGRSLEVHLLDFEGDLYGKTLRVGFVARLRGEQKFPNVDALRAQIAQDVVAGRDAVKQCAPAWLAWV